MLRSFLKFASTNEASYDSHELIIQSLKAEVYFLPKAHFPSMFCNFLSK